LNYTEQADFKIFALKKLRGYKKAVPIAEIKDLWLEESKFTIRFDLPSFPISPTVNLWVGDRCKVNYNFYHELRNKSLISTWNAEKGLQILLGKAEDEYGITAFVEMKGRHYQEIFCVLNLIPNVADEYYFDNVLRAKDESSLLLFWPQSLEKVK
jgi:hypothetical protein